MPTRRGAKGAAWGKRNSTGGKGAGRGVHTGREDRGRGEASTPAKRRAAGFMTKQGGRDGTGAVSESQPSGACDATRRLEPSSVSAKAGTPALAVPGRAAQ